MTHAGDPQVVWEKLKKLCAADPKKAQRLVMVSKQDVFKALKESRYFQPKRSLNTFDFSNGIE